ncbi:MAG: cytochrome c [Deltaproteobacteria bacterium]|nr:MAG: cytochrome c [Deltaproteobacteria bacterium]
MRVATVILTSLLVAAMGPSRASAADVQAGEALYMANCMACHGAAGDGKGPAAAALNPKPADFTSAAYWDGKTDDFLKQVIRTGKPDTAMMPFAQLSDSDIDNLVAFIKSKKPAK